MNTVVTDLLSFRHISEMLSGQNNCHLIPMPTYQNKGKIKEPSRVFKDIEDHTPDDHCLHW